jgi:enoyl-CoA hydratase/carnithine racemase
VRAVVLTGAGDNFCSGGDVHEIIGPLTQMAMPELLRFTRMTGDLVKAMRACPQPIVAAIDGVCAGAGAMLALAADYRLATATAKTAFLFTRVGLAGCDMGACTLLPRVIGQGRAADLLYSGRALEAEEGERWGFYSAIVAREQLQEATMWLMQNGMSNFENAGASSNDYLHLFGLSALALMWGKMAKAALEKRGSGEAFYENKLITARYFFERVLPDATSHLAKVKTGAGPVMALQPDAF